MTGAVPLADLAAIWVERWLTYGGGLVADHDSAKLNISMSMGRWRRKHGPHHQRLWHDGWTAGRWRELQELAELIPGLWEAIVDHVIEHGEPWGSTSRTMYRYAEHTRWPKICETGAAAQP